MDTRKKTSALQRVRNLGKHCNQAMISDAESDLQPPPLKRATTKDITMQPYHRTRAGQRLGCPGTDARAPGSSSSDGQGSSGDAQGAGSSSVRDGQDLSGDAQGPGSSSVRDGQDLSGDAQGPGSSSVRRDGQDSSGDAQGPGSSSVRDEQDSSGDAQGPGSSSVRDGQESSGDAQGLGSSSGDGQDSAQACPATDADTPLETGNSSSEAPERFHIPVVRATTIIL